jgi:hypothetical protein
MQFRLLYEGPLKSNGDRQDKQALRRYFHAQLKELVQCKPYAPLKRLIDTKHDAIKFIPIGNFTFVPLAVRFRRAG